MKKEDVKVALCFHGLVGSMQGKHYQLQGGSDKVLELSYKHNRENILDQYDTDVFYHTWSTECEEQIEDLYKPALGFSCSQIDFDIPGYIKADKDRAFAHLSRWFSFSTVIRDCLSVYQIYGNPDIIYTHVLVQRWDLCWNVIPAFETMNPEYFWVGNSTLNINKEWSDRWFCSSVENMKNFSTLFNKIPDYMKPEGTLPSKKQYKGISSHFLSKHHAEQLGLQPKFKYNFGGYNQKPNHYNEVRRQYGKDDR